MSESALAGIRGSFLHAIESANNARTQRDRAHYFGQAFGYAQSLKVLGDSTVPGVKTIGYVGSVIDQALDFMGSEQQLAEILGPKDGWP